MITSLKNKFPKFECIVEMDNSGFVEDSSNEENAEDIAAMSSYTLQTIEELGEILGLGEINQIGLDGGSERWLIAKHLDKTYTCYGKENKGSIFQSLHKLQKELKH
jgi:predicted regulator of Ras-like GTPase activity (Roadblock/LC7/MglB family)